MMWRWISEVPSQMRSTRASRQNRASGRSLISPIPPWTWIASSVTRASISEAYTFAEAISRSAGEALVEAPRGSQRQPVRRVDLP